MWSGFDSYEACASMFCKTASAKFDSFCTHSNFFFFNLPKISYLWIEKKVWAYKKVFGNVEHIISRLRIASDEEICIIFRAAFNSSHTVWGSCSERIFRGFLFRWLFLTKIPFRCCEYRAIIIMYISLNVKSSWWFLSRKNNGWSILKTFHELGIVMNFYAILSLESFQSVFLHTNLVFFLWKII